MENFLNGNVFLIFPCDQEHVLCLVLVGLVRNCDSITNKDCGISVTVLSILFLSWSFLIVSSFRFMFSPVFWSLAVFSSNALMFPLLRSFLLRLRTASLSVADVILFPSGSNRFNSSSSSWQPLSITALEFLLISSVLSSLMSSFSMSVSILLSRDLNPGALSTEIAMLVGLLIDEDNTIKPPSDPVSSQRE